MNMYQSKLIYFLVQLFLIICDKSANSLTIYTYENDKKEILTKEHITENENLHIRIYMKTNITKESCSGTCNVEGKKVNLSCKVVEKQNTYLNVSVLDNITKEHSGKWRCDYFVIKRQRNETNNIKITLNSNFQLEVKTIFFDTITMTWIVSILVVIVLFIIIVQTCCIIYFRRKAKAVSREAKWSNGNNDKKDSSKPVRYTKMPGLKKEEVLIPESRESGIYEVLENIRVAPEPPPVESLPGKKAVQTPPAVPTEAPTSSPWGTLSLNSLLRRKKKKVEDSESDSKTSTIDKRTTLERIKARDPLPLPTEEDVYEAVEETPPPIRKDIKKKAAKEKPLPKEEFQAFPQAKPKPAVPLPTNIANVAPPSINSQLKQAVENRNRLKPVQPHPQPPKPQSKVLPTPKEQRQNPTPQPPIPKQKPWQNESTLPKVLVLPKETTLPKAKAWPKEATTPKQKEWPREPPSPPQETQQEPQRPMGSLRPTVKPQCYNPGLPPPDAPAAKIRTPRGEAVPPKPRPPPPVKPKQLHPLPHPPCEPEHIQVVTENADTDRDSDDSEDWVYEQLPQYNIYSM